MFDSAWLTAMVDQRLASMKEAIKLSEAAGGQLVLTTLTEPEADTTEALDRWERTCDSCGKDCADSGFYTGSVSKDVGLTQVVITFGICAACAGKS